MDIYEKTLEPFSSMLSKEQFYKLCRISKKTALDLFESGLVPVVDTHRKTCRFFVSKKDTLFYLRERDKHPEKYQLRTKQWVQTHPEMNPLSKQESLQLRQYMCDQWQNEADLFSVSDINRLTGYSTPAIRRWIQQKQLRCMMIRGAFYIPKAYVLDFICSNTYHQIKRKSSVHTLMLKEMSL